MVSDAFAGQIHDGVDAFEALRPRARCSVGCPGDVIGDARPRSAGEDPTECPCVRRADCSARPRNPEPPAIMMRTGYGTPLMNTSLAVL